MVFHHHHCASFSCWRGASTYLRIRDSTSSCLIEFLSELGSLLVGDVEAARLNQSLKLVLGHGTIIIQVAGVESLIDVEARLSLESLTDGLSGDLGLEVNSPHVSELNLSVSHEAVITSVERVSVVRGTSVDHVSIVRVLGNKGIGELVESKSAVSVAVVSSHEQLNLLGGGVNSDGGEPISEISDRNPTTEVLVEDSEGILQVEITLKSKRSLGGLDLTLKGDSLAKRSNELILLVQMKNGASGGRGASVHGTDLTARRASSGGAFSDRRGASCGGSERSTGSSGGVSSGAARGLQGRAVRGSQKTSSVALSR